MIQSAKAETFGRTQDGPVRHGGYSSGPGTLYVWFDRLTVSLIPYSRHSLALNARMRTIQPSQPRTTRTTTIIPRTLKRRNRRQGRETGLVGVVDMRVQLEGA